MMVLQRYIKILIKTLKRQGASMSISSLPVQHLNINGIVRSATISLTNKKKKLTL